MNYFNKVGHLSYVYFQFDFLKIMSWFSDFNGVINIDLKNREIFNGINFNFYTKLVRFPTDFFRLFIINCVFIN